MEQNKPLFLGCVAGGGQDGDPCHLSRGGFLPHRLVDYTVHCLRAAKPATVFAQRGNYSEVSVDVRCSWAK